MTQITQVVHDYGEDVCSFGDRLSDAIKRAGGATNMARKAGVSESVLRKWRAEHSDPSRIHLINLANAAGISVEWLATGYGEPERTYDKDMSGSVIDLDALERVLLMVRAAEGGKGSRLSGAAYARVVRMLYDWLINNHVPLTQKIVNDVVDSQFASELRGDI